MARLVSFLAFGVATISGATLIAQPPAQQSAASNASNDKRPAMHRVAGVRDGASAFARVDYPQLKPKVAGQLDFAHFHTYDETVA